MDTVPTTPSISSDAGQQKKYIRTFAGDFETLKNGGTPNLAPLTVVSPPSPPIESPPPLPPPPTSLPSPVVVQPPVASSISPSEPLKTYGGDFMQRMKETKASTATILAAEQDAAPIRVQSSRQKIATSSIIYSVAGVLLLLVGGFGAFIAYNQYLSTSAPVTIVPAVLAPIFVDEREAISGAGTALMQDIQQSMTRSLPSGAVRLLYVEQATGSTGSPQATTNIFSALQLPAPGALLRNINPAHSMVGIVNEGGVQSPFFILSVASYSDSFAALLSWEPVMPRDLAKLFPPIEVAIPDTTIATSTLATTTPSLPTVPAGFFDETIANHDVRVYRDTSGRDILLYGYWNQTTLIIARDAAAFTEIIGRLATSRTQ